jgi:hypothetical protein
MNGVFWAAFLMIAFSVVDARAQGKTFFQTVAGNWAGTLEYQDYSADRRVKLNTYLTITPSADGNSAKITTVYDDFGTIMKSTGTQKIDAGAQNFIEGDNSYRIDSIANGKIVLLGQGQDGERSEPFRRTITFDENTIVILKETRAPWQFRHRLSLRRTNENVLAARTLAPAQLKEDFAVLKRTLTTLHPGIYRYNTPENLEKAFAEYERKLIRPLPEGEFFLLVSQFWHTYANPYNQNALVRERLFNGKTYLPFYFRIVDGRMIVTENASPNALAKGSEITRINGLSVNKIIEKLLTVTKADGNSTLEHRLSSLELTRPEAERYALFDWYFPLFFPLKDEDFTIEAIDFRSGKKRRFRTPAMTRAERKEEMARRYGTSPTYDDGWKFEIRDNFAGYLKIDNSITWRLKSVKFKEFLAAAFAELRTKNIKSLIIDLRGNSGGSMDIGFELARYLARETLPTYAESKRLVRNVAARPDLLKNLETYSDELKQGLKNGLPSSSFRKFDGQYFEIVGRQSYPGVEPYADSFKWKTYIISDSSNASASFQFLQYVRENKLAVIVGQPAGGNRQGINGGNYFFLYLPNSKIEIDIPVYFSAPLTPQKDESVIPDILVRKQKGDLGNNFDRELETIKKLIR